MKKYRIILLVFIFISLNACFVKEPEPRKPTVFGKSNIPVNDNLAYTQPNCQLTDNTTNGNYANFIITFTTVEKTKKSTTITQIYATNSNNDEIIILINNLNEKSANFKIVPQINISKNEAYVEMNANSLHPSSKIFLESGTGTLHVFYDDGLKEWKISFCDFKFNYFGNPPIVNGKIVVN